MAHTPVAKGGGTSSGSGGVLGPGAQRGVNPWYFRPSTLPDWWGITNSSGSEWPTYNYGDMRLKYSGAIAPDKYLPVAYGIVRVGGTELKLQGKPGYEMLYGWGAVAWCEGEIESVDAIYVNGNRLPAPYTTSKVIFSYTNYKGAVGDPTFSSAGQLFGPYLGVSYDVTGFHDCAFTYFDITTLVGYPLGPDGWWSLIDTTGAETAEWAADIHGLKIYDPRSLATAFSRNPVLIVRDLLKRGKRLTNADIDDVSFAAMADVADAKGFTCDVAFGALTNADAALAIVLQTCNGFLTRSDGKTGIQLDVVNASPAAATFTEADGDISKLKYEWVSVREMVTQLIVRFPNSTANWTPDVTPPVAHPLLASGLVPFRELIVDVPGVSTLAAAVKIRDYLFNRQFVRFRVNGWMSSKAETLSEGMKVHLTTLKGIDADYLIEQVTPGGDGFFNFVAKPYSASVYSSTPQTQGPPIFPPYYDPSIVPDAPYFNLSFGGVDVTSPSIISQWTPQLYYDAPRTYDAITHYTSTWTTGAAVTGFDASKVNDGVTNVSCGVADTYYNDGWFYLDLGAGNDKDFISVKVTAATAPGADWHIEGSDDGITYATVYPSLDTETSGAGPYDAFVHWPSIGAHRYWRIGFGTFDMAWPPGVVTLDVTEIQFYTANQRFFPLSHIEIRQHDANGAILGRVPVHKCVVTGPIDISPWAQVSQDAGIPNVVIDLWFTVINRAGNAGTGRALYFTNTGTLTPAYPTQAFVAQQTGAAATVAQAGVSLGIDGASLSGTKDFIETGTPPALSAAGQYRMYVDNTGTIQVSHNGGAFAPLSTGGGGASNDDVRNEFLLMGA